VGFQCDFTQIPPAPLLCKEEEYFSQKIPSIGWLPKIPHPLSPLASDQLQELNSLMQDFEINVAQDDQWHYIWGDALFTVKKAYTQLKGMGSPDPLFKWIWGSCTRGKHKFFSWQFLLDHINTRNLLRRKRRNLQSYYCVVCPNTSEETPFHLFFQCSFS
jgi:hypothetical protein